jgi:hypothetical protein
MKLLRLSFSTTSRVLAGPETFVRSWLRSDAPDTMTDHLK